MKEVFSVLLLIGGWFLGGWVVGQLFGFPLAFLIWIAWVMFLNE